MNADRQTRFKPSPALLAVILGLLVLGVYWPAAHFDFLHWDDPQHLTQNPLMNPPALANIGYYWERPYFGLYIPVTYTAWTLFALMTRIPSPAGGSELNPYLFHSLNIAVHILSALLVWRLLIRLVRQPMAAWFGAALFALHPMCVEPVAWVSGFRDVLGGALALASLWAYLPKQELPAKAGSPQGAGGGDVLRYVLATILFLLAILAKPTSMAVIPMALAIDFVWLRGRIFIIAAKLLPWAIAALLLILMTHRMQGLPAAIDTPPLWQRLLVAGDALAFYLGKVFWPIHLCVQYDHSPHRVLASGWAIKATALATGACVVIVLLGLRWRWVWLAGAIFLAALLPVLGIVPFYFQYFSTVADRYVYLALLAPAMAMAFILAAHPTRNLYFLASAILLAAGILSFRQVWVWQSTESLFMHVLVVNPHSNLAPVKLSREKLLAGDPRAAERLARDALAARPDDSLAWINLGAALEDLHEPDRARDCYLHVVETDPTRDSAGAYSNLAAMRAEGGDLSGAIKLYHEALAHDPDLVEARIGLTRAERQLAARK